MRNRKTVLVVAPAALLASMLVPVSTGAASAPTIETVAGGHIANAPASDIALRPSGISVAPDGTRYVADAGAGRVWRVTPEGLADVVMGTGRSCKKGSSTKGTDCAEDRDLSRPQRALDAYLPAPNALAASPDGTVAISDTSGHQVLRLDPVRGLVDVLAGDGSTAYEEQDEGGDARNASLSSPASIAYDAAGALYIADTGNRLVRRVEPSGRITTVVGCRRDCAFTLRDRTPLATTVLPTSFTLALSPDGRLYVASATAVFTPDLDKRVWRRVAGDEFAAGTEPGQGEGGPAGRARFRSISALAFSPVGDLYLADGGWERVQRIDAPATSASTVRHVGGCSCEQALPGDGGPAVAAAFAMEGSGTPRGWIAVDGDAVLVSDAGHHRLRRIDAAGFVTTLAGNGVAAPATRIAMPFDYQPNDVNGGFSGDGRDASTAQLFGPVAVAAATDGTVYVVDRHAKRVRRITPDGVITTVAGSGCVGRGCTAPPAWALGDGGPATSAQLDGATAVALDRSGTQLYIADQRHNRVRQVNLSSTRVTVYPEASAPVRIEPGGIATVVGTGAQCSNVTLYCGDGRVATDATLAEPSGLAVDAHGVLYVADVRTHQVRRVEPRSGVITSVVGVPFWSACEPQTQEDHPGAATLLCGPTALTFGPDGALYVAESGDYGFGSGFISRLAAPRVRRVDINDPWHVSTVVAGKGQVGYGGDGGPARDALLAHPRGLAFGPDGALYIADSGNSRIRRVAKDGTISTVAGRGQIVASSSSNLTLLGCDYDGDGGAAEDAGLCAPLGIASVGDTLYVADELNNAVRAIRGL